MVVITLDILVTSSSQSDSSYFCALSSYCDTTRLIILADIIIWPDTPAKWFNFHAIFYLCWKFVIACIVPYCGIPLWIDCLLSFSAASSICIVPYLSVLPVLSLLRWSQQTPYHQWKFLFLLFEAQTHTPFKFIFVSVGDKLNITLSFFSLRCIETANEGITSKLRSRSNRLRIMTLKNLLLDKKNSLVIQNKLIELYHP